MGWVVELTSGDLRTPPFTDRWGICHHTGDSVTSGDKPVSGSRKASGLPSTRCTRIHIAHDSPDEGDVLLLLFFFFFDESGKLG